MDTETLVRIIDERQEELFGLLCRLIRIDSQNFGSRGKEKEIAEHVAELCRGMELETETYSPLDVPGFREHPDYIEGHGLEDRLNVTARLPGRVRENGLMLMGHLDTVPIGDRALWSFAPLAGEIREGRIWGRGACDDKYALATCLFLLKLLTENGFTPKKDLLFTGYCDEEAGGSHGALASVLRYPTARIVNMDCKNFQIWHCASGGGCMRLRFRSKKPTDSAGDAARAVPEAMRAIDAFGERRRAELENNRFYRGTVIPRTSLRYLSARAGIGGDAGAAEISFSFYTDRSKEEIAAELVEMKKDVCRRIAPFGMELCDLLPTTRFFHYAFSEPDCAPIRELIETARETTGRELTPCGSCLSDLSVILKYGSNEAFGFGIGRDFDAEGGAHRPDEFIGCGELTEYAKIIGAYILRVLS